MNNEKVTRHLYYGLILLCITAIIAYSSFLVIALIERNKQTSLQTVNSGEWFSIKTILDEEISKATLNSNAIANTIKSEALVAYPVKSELGYDLKNISQDSRIFKIFNKNVKGVYLNGVANDNNDIYILSPTLGIIFDLSTNCAIDTWPKSFDKEVEIHNNTILVDKALRSLIIQSTNKYIFWNYLKTPEEYSYIREISDMSIDEIKICFDKYGLDGLAYFEFFGYTPVDQHGDMLGIADVSNAGIKNDNNKFIIVQGFNLKDAIDTVHPSFGLYYDNLRSDIIKTYDFQKTVVGAISVIIYLALLTAFISLMRNMNKTVL